MPTGGGSGGGFGGMPSGKGGLAVGGGALGIIGIIVFVILSMVSGGGGASSSPGLLQGLADSGSNSSLDSGQLASSCRTGADAATNEDCANVAFINSIQDYWSDTFAASGVTYRPATTVFYSGQTPTGCGPGDKGMGPFYCPADQRVYVDLTFWEELKNRFGGNDAPFTQAYVLAHEYGHHVQNLLGTSDRVGNAVGATSGAVRLELQADCYAGVWANHATSTPGADGQVLITDISQTDLNNALQTAGIIGDDYIQSELAGQRVDPSQFSHGTSAQRQKWFTTGYQTGQPQACNTFETNDLG